MGLELDKKRHLFPSELIDQDVLDWEAAGVEFVLHKEFNEMSTSEYNAYYKG